MNPRVSPPARIVLATIAVVTLGAGCASGSSGQPGITDTGKGSAGRGASANSHQGASNRPQRGGGRGHGGTASATPSASADVVIEAAVRDGEVSPAPHRVNIDRGEVVRLVIRSDHRDAVHVHGYDLEQPVRPGDPAVFTFTADVPGVFEVETHDPALHVVQLQVR